MNQILQGDCLAVLRTLPDKSVNTCVTSPPYYGLRDYGTASWVGGNDDCQHTINDGTADPKKGEVVERPMRGVDRDFCVKCGAERTDCQLGLENTPEEYVAKMVEVFRGVRRVLRDDGTLWLNLGDCYNTTPPGNKNPMSKSGLNGSQTSESYRKRLEETQQRQQESRKTWKELKPKDLVGIPWRVAFALQADGWYLRSDIIWNKPNPMPESVTDRPTKSHEYIFLLSKSEKYYYNHEAIKEPLAESSIQRLAQDIQNQTGSTRGNGGAKTNGNMKAVFGPPRGSRGVIDSLNGGRREEDKEFVPPTNRNKRSVWTVPTHCFREAHFATFPPKLIEPCILAGCPVGGVVMDNFFGSGTVGKVAIKYGRQFIGIELNPAYIEIAKRRLANVQATMTFDEMEVAE